MKPSLAQVCTLNSSFADDVREYSAGQCRHIELWLTKLETYLREHSVEDVRRLLDEHAMEAPVASFHGGLFESQGDARREAWEFFERRLALCQELGVQTLIVACDVAGPLNQVDLERVQMSMVQAAQAAGRRRLRLALEFQADAAFGNNLETAAAIVAEVASPHLGICLDAFHYHVGPSKPDDLQYLHRGNLYHVQLCDLADVPREFARDSNRILPGEGDIPLQPILQHLRHIDYQDCVSVELFNSQIWQVGPRQFGEIAMTSLRRLLGLASMGDERDSEES